MAQTIGAAKKLRSQLGKTTGDSCLCCASLLGYVEDCVVTLMCWLGGQHLFFAIDQTGGVEGGNLEAVAVSNGVGGAGLDAVAAEDAAVVVNVIDLGIALGAADAVLGGILGGLNINAIRRTS